MTNVVRQWRYDYYQSLRLLETFKTLKRGHAKNSVLNQKENIIEWGPRNIESNVFSNTQYTHNTPHKLHIYIA